MTIPQAVTINFARGVETKIDPYQIDIGSFLDLKNTVFTEGKRLTKRNGFWTLAALSSPSSYLTTFNDDLTSISSILQSYSASTNQWVTKGSITPVGVSVLPLVRNNFNQIQTDSVVAPNGLICTAYAQTDGSTVSFKYVIADSVTGQNIIAPHTLSSTTTHSYPRVFLMERYFIIAYAGTSSHLNFIAVSLTDPTQVTSAKDISGASYSPSTSTGSFDGVVMNGLAYFAWNDSSGGGIKMTYINPNLSSVSVVNRDASHVCTLMSLCADATNNVVWATYYDLASTHAYTLAVDHNLNLISGFPLQVVSSGTILNIASAPVFGGGEILIFLETSHTDNGIQTNYIDNYFAIQTASVGGFGITPRGVGLASKAFLLGENIYYLACYDSPNQNTLFLITYNGFVSKVLAKIAYQNATGYLITGLPGVGINGNTAQISYLYKDLIEPVNKNTAVPSGNQTASVYSQLGINLASFEIGSNPNSAEIGNNLNITGGFLASYDGFLETEQGFFLYPDSVQNTATATTGGHLSAQIYYAQFCYEWTDNQGNALRSSPSVPVIADIHSSGTSTNTLTWVVPTLRLTYKTTNPIKIVGYRWSAAQQNYYQFTSIIAPTLNDPTVDSVTIVDTLSDASILGNNLLYTTGGVIENIGPPAASAVTLFDDRLWLIDAEDQNLLWYSKQVIEATPVEMSDLLTIYVAPTIGSQGPTGPMKALGTMDDKIVICKKDALYYINGTGPDNTGANNQYSKPVFITSMVGCSNQSSIIFQPQGLMFEYSSSAGNQIWLLQRDLETQYIGAPVEGYTKNATILSAVAVPGTNQVRFNMSSGITLMYDYYYNQWGTFTTAGVSSCIYGGLHAYIDSFGRVFQETPGKYLDGSTPVLISFTTGWINAAGLRGYERIYEYSFLGTYYSPHKLIVQTAYDYGFAAHSTTYSPPNFTPNYGGDPIYGNGSPYGGSNVEQFRVHAKKQKCKAFQIQAQEVFDPSFGTVAGQGVSLSGITAKMGFKKGWAPVAARNSVG